MTWIHLLLGIAGGLVAGLALGWIALRSQFSKRFTDWCRTRNDELREEEQRYRQKLEAQAEADLNERRDQLERAREIERERFRHEGDRQRQLEERLRRDEEVLSRREDQLAEREQAVEAKLTTAERRDAKTLAREEQLEQREVQLVEREEAVAQRAESIDSELERIAGLAPDQAREQLFARLDEELAQEQDQLIRRRSEQAEKRAKEIAIEHVARAIQRYAAEHTVETTTARVPIADEELKGRIIGKEGRNIRAFEQQSGADLIIDDTPDFITISCFDGMRREIARRALLELLEDGRIHPARIEEVLIRVQQDMDRQVLELGEDAAYACDVSGLHPNLLKLLGKLQFRTSYGQNVLQHTKEVAFLTGALASDLGLDPKLGRRCGLMHDIGKALDHEQEGSHPELGCEALKRYGENEVVCNAALAHHEGRVVTSIYTTLTAAADAISAARPGARRENVERYLKRLQALEDIACAFTGVRKAYAIQAGRELRVIVNEHNLSDGVLNKTARAIARRIEDEVAYPGEVKVTLIREVRQVAVAR